MHKDKINSLKIGDCIIYRLPKFANSIEIAYEIIDIFDKNHLVRLANRKYWEPRKYFKIKTIYSPDNNLSSYPEFDIYYKDLLGEYYISNKPADYYKKLTTFK